MKKVLYASTALLLTAGVAAAEVSITGSGRAGLVYTENSSSDSNTVVSYRLRFNIDASKETDSGVKFGGRIRLQDSNNTVGSGNGQAQLSAAYVYAEANGFRVEVGNVNTAYDSAALMYNSELGYIGRSFGDPNGNYFSFDSNGYTSTGDRIGVFVSYTIDNLNVQGSIVDPVQTADTTNVVGTADELEYGGSASYKLDAFTISGAFVINGAGFDGNDQYYVGGEYAVNDAANIGLQYFDNGDYADLDPVTTLPITVDNGQQVTLYGNYKLANGIKVGAYVAYNDELGNVAGGQDTSYGVGAEYDLGGATVLGYVAQGYDGNTTADVGVNFSF